MQSIIDAFKAIIDFLSNLGDFIEGVFERVVYWIVIWYIEAKLWTLEFSYSIATRIIENFGISSYLESAWSSIDSEVLSVLTYLQVPEGINLVVSAMMTRFVMDLMP